jgi:hypothetical protein
MRDGSLAFQLPAGMASADESRFFSAQPLGTVTTLSAFNLASGELEREIELDGNWALAGLAPNGGWIALVRVTGDKEQQAWQAAGRWETHVQIVNTATGEPAHFLNLEGNFEVETVSDDGQSLFMIQHLPAINPDYYLIRLYDLSEERLIADPLRSKTGEDIMAGYAWGGVASRDGRWLLTLYLSTSRNVAFIHALDLKSKFPVCIDLPLGEGDFEALRHYTLALSADGQTVYAANPALGIVAEVSLGQGDFFGVLRQAAFAPSPMPDQSNEGGAPAGRSVLSPDGSTLFFTNGAELWSYDTQAATVAIPIAAGRDIVGLNVTGDGQRLHVAHLDGTVSTFDTASNAAVDIAAAGR